MKRDARAVIDTGIVTTDKLDDKAREMKIEGEKRRKKQEERKKRLLAAETMEDLLTDVIA